MGGRSIDNALSREKLDLLKPSTEKLFQNTRRATTWYNEAVWTAAMLFVEAAKESEKFRQDFQQDVQESKTIEYEDGETSTIEVDAWRNTMKQEVPEYHEKVMGIGLSAFQGGSAEQQARRYIKENLE